MLTTRKCGWGEERREKGVLPVPALLTWAAAIAVAAAAITPWTAAAGGIGSSVGLLVLNLHPPQVQSHASYTKASWGASLSNTLLGMGLLLPAMARLHRAVAKTPVGRGPCWHPLLTQCLELVPHLSPLAALLHPDYCAVDPQFP